MDLDHFATHGWLHLPLDPDTLHWAEAAERAGHRVLADPAMRAQWLQCEDTWFVGVDALPTAPDGSIDGVPLAGAAIALLRPLPALHPAQLSVTFPGYPRPRAGDSAASFAYRLKRDAAHVDGIIADGLERRRFVLEPHDFILGLPLNVAPPEASPLVVWEGSHRVMGQALRAAFGAVATDELSRVDVTEVYTNTRRAVFETCNRRPLPARPGEALILHRHLLHGIAPWVPAPVDGAQSLRMMAYFRPLCEGGVRQWLSQSARIRAV